jgi:hypothetical protein
VLALELRLVPNFDVVALIGIRHDEEWVVDATFALQLVNGEISFWQEAGNFSGFSSDEFRDVKRVLQRYFHPLQVDA